MSESKHTPGPWTIGDLWQSPNAGCTIEAGDHYIADVYAGHHISDKVQADEGKANAALIAAAPDTARQRDELLEAAEYVLDTLRAAQADAGAHGHDSMVSYLFAADNKLCAAIAHAKETQS